MKKQKLAALAWALMTVLCLFGCGKTTDTNTGADSKDTKSSVETQTEAVREEKSREQEREKTPDTAILVVSFGTSYNDSREKTIGAIENAIGAACTEYEVRRAFTAQMIIDKLKKRDGLIVDNVAEALERAAAEGIENLVVQPTHLMDGLEYQEVLHEVMEYKKDFKNIVVGQPLLTADEDFEALAKAITDATKEYDDGETAIVYMGHGTEAESNQVYEKMQETLEKIGFENYWIGTVEAEPTLEEVMASMEEKGTYKKVVLAPLMVVCGDHANNDMAGEEADSWKSILTANGYETECLLQGLGELEAIQDIYVDHAKEAVSRLSSGLIYSHSMDLKYASEFSVDYYEEGYAEIDIGGVCQYLLVPEGKPVPEGLGEGIVILKQPIQNIYLSASGVMDMFISIDKLDSIRFSSLKRDGWCLEEARQAMEEGDILYAGKYSAPDYELLLSKGCGLAVENTMIYHTPQVKEQLERMGIPVLVDCSSKEREPLGRSEWVRLYGLLTGRGKEAEQAFLRQAVLYEEVREEAEAEQRKVLEGKSEDREEENRREEDSKNTAAFFYITMDGKVNMRRPSDYLAKMVETAGGVYIFPDRGQEESKGSTEVLQMEEFYAAAMDADVLIYNSTVDGELESIRELTDKNELLKNFKAVQKGNVYCTRDELYQSSMEMGTILFDLYEIFQGRDDMLTYFYRLTK